MRRMMVSLLMIVILGALVWVLAPGETQPLEMVPAQAMGAVLADRFPESLDFLARTRVGEWLDLERLIGQNRPEMEWFSFLRDSLERACLIVHSVERKENGALRPHLTVLLKPGHRRRQFVEDWIRQKVVDRFGGSHVTSRRTDSVEEIRGPEKGQVLYLSMERGWLIVSNSEPGWKDVQLVLAERGPSLEEKQGFREIRSQIGSNYDLFFYFGGEAGLLLPEFGYGVRVSGDEVVDNYYSLDR